LAGLIGLVLVGALHADGGYPGDGFEVGIDM